MSSSSSTTERLFATCTHGLEKWLEQELTALGIEGAEVGASGVYLPHTIENIYKVNYCSRIASRLLLPLSRFACPNREALYKNALKIDWSRFLTPERTFAVDANVQDTAAFKNSHFASLVIKDAVCDQMRQRFNSRPNVDVKCPAIQINLYINKAQATLCIDTSGTPLFKRGWRVETSEAPLQETLAAALLQISGYNGEQILFDPFCGSGTILIEAAMIATRTPAGFFRKWWGFFYLPEHTEKGWNDFKAEQDKARLPLKPGQILGSDNDPEAIDSAYQNLVKTGFDKEVQLIVRDIKNLRHPIRPTLIATNPPYGVRLEADLATLQAFGSWVRKQNAPAFFLYPDEPGIESATSLPLKRTAAFYNGGLKVAVYSVA